MKDHLQRGHWKFQPLAATVDAAGVQNQWYTVLDTTKNVRVYSLWAKQVNDEAANKTVVVKVTLDGIESTKSEVMNNNSLNRYSWSAISDSVLERAPGTFLFGYHVAIHARSVKVEVRSTSVAGTNQHLYGYVRYATWEALP